MNGNILQREKGGPTSGGESRYFFFQAEDGIRDADVTGVQTWALPISFRHHRHDDFGTGVGVAGDVAGKLKHVGHHLGFTPGGGGSADSLPQGNADTGGFSHERSQKEDRKSSCRERVWVAVGGGA